MPCGAQRERTGFFFQDLPTRETETCPESKRLTQGDSVSLSWWTMKFSFSRSRKLACWSVQDTSGHAGSTKIKKESSHNFSSSQLDPFRSLVIYPSTLAKYYRKETGKETKTYEERVKLPELFENKNQRLWVELIIPARHWGPSEQSPEAAGGDGEKPVSRTHTHTEHLLTPMEV